MMKEITRNDFNLFQDEMLGLIKKFDSKSTEKISLLISNIQKSELLSEQKFENFKCEVQELLKNLETNKAILNLDDKIKELTKKIEELKSINNTKISNFERDLSNACFKYDKIFLNNISSPGLIGNGCPYPTMRAFLEYANNKIKEFISSKEKFGFDFQKYQDAVKSSLDEFRKEMINIKDEIDKNLRKEIKAYDKRSTEKMNAVEDKLSFIRIENGRYNFNLNKKWEELEEKLQSFYFMNDNLVKLYNNTRKEFLKTQKEVNNICQYLNYTKSSSSNGNKTTYDKFNKKIELNKPQGITNSESVLPFINSSDDITKNIFNTSKKHINNINNTNAKINLKKKLFVKKNTVNLDIGLFSFNKLNRTKNINKNLLSEMSAEYGFDDSTKNIKSEISEAKFRKKLSFLRKKNSDLIIENKNETSKHNSKENIKEMNNIILEEETDNKEKKDQQTSPYIDKKTRNKTFDNTIIIPNKISSFTFERKELGENKNNKEEKKIEEVRQKYSEEFNEIKDKFEDFYENSNVKINFLMEHINKLTKNMNKIIFNKKDIFNLNNETDSIFELKNNKKSLFTNSGNQLLFPKNKSFEKKLNKTTKEKEIEKDNNNIPNIKHELTTNRKLIINDQYLNKYFKYNNMKTPELRGNSDDIMKLFNNKDKKPHNFYVKMLNFDSINKIENFLIKKFTEHSM